MVSFQTPDRPTGRGGVSAFLGPFVRNHLITNGPSNPVDIHNAYKGVIDILITAHGWPWRDSTFKSFMSWLRMAARLGLVERTDLTEPAIRPQDFLNDRSFWQLTDLGRQNEDLWISVRRNLYPEGPGVRAGYSQRARVRAKDRIDRITAQGGVVPTGPPSPRRRGRPRRRPVTVVEGAVPEGEELSPRERRELREREREPGPLTREEEAEAEEASRLLAELAGEPPPPVTQPPRRRGRRPRAEEALTPSEAAEAQRQAEILRRLAESTQPPLEFQ